MNVFKKYSAYYDLLYKDKDYSGEALYVHKIIQNCYPEASSILSLGCGTGNYEFELSKYGYEILGIDISEEMISLATAKSESEPVNRVSFEVADIRTFSSSRRFDVVISLFHVISYQINNLDVLSAFSTAYQHLNRDGVFLFDYWYGPNVLLEGPGVRSKCFENELLYVHRVSNPNLKLLKNLVEINFSIDGIDKKNEETFKFNEQHNIRYFFHPEILEFGDRAGLKFERSLSWMSVESEPGLGWYALTALKR